METGQSHRLLLFLKPIFYRAARGYLRVLPSSKLAHLSQHRLPTGRGTAARESWHHFTGSASDRLTQVSYTRIYSQVPPKAPVSSPAQLPWVLRSAGSGAGRIRLKLSGKGMTTAKCCSSGGRRYRLEAARGYPISHDMA